MGGPVRSRAGHDPDRRGGRLARWYRGSRYIAQRGLAGRGLVAVAVADLGALLADLRGRGVDVPPVETSGDGPSRVVLTDPDGNEVTLFEDPAAGEALG